jgi:uncharacterized protein (TIGR02594 family)
MSRVASTGPVGSFKPPKLYNPPDPNTRLLDPRWLSIARTQLGIREVRGRGSNPKIIEYLRTCRNLKPGKQKYGQDNDDTAWCSAFVNWCMQQSGIQGTAHALASSWINWGYAMSPGMRGAVVVIRKGNGMADKSTGSSTGNHVGFLIERTAGHVRLLGGNQGGGTKVCESTFSLSTYTILAVRWPYRSDAPTVAIA